MLPILYRNILMLLGTVFNGSSITFIIFFQNIKKKKSNTFQKMYLFLINKIIIKYEHISNCQFFIFFSEIMVIFVITDVKLK